MRLGKRDRYVELMEGGRWFCICHPQLQCNALVWNTEKTHVFEGILDASRRQLNHMLKLRTFCNFASLVLFFFVQINIKCSKQFLSSPIFIASPRISPDASSRITGEVDELNDSPDDLKAGSGT